MPETPTAAMKAARKLLVDAIAAPPDGIAHDGCLVAFAGHPEARQAVAAALDAFAAERIEEATDGDHVFARLAQTERERDAALAKLEAAETKLAGLDVCPDDSAPWRHYKACHDPKGWPADLLEAVQEAVLREADDLPDEIREARATLRRYGLLKKEAR